MSLRVIRFGPLEGYGKWVRTRFVPGRLGEDGFPEGTYEDIPPNTRLRIEVMPGRKCIFDGRVTGMYSQNFEVGKYTYLLKKDLPMPEDDPGAKYRCMTASGEFLVDITEEQWSALRDMRAKYCSRRQSSDGPSWVCDMCDHSSHTAVSAFLHESREHFNIDPLKDPQKATLVEAGVLKPTATQGPDPAIQRVAKKRKGRGGRAAAPQ